jgi:TonB-dependent starch-binding outer membrane protein SusC
MKKIVERVCSFYYGHRKKLLIMRNTVLILLISAFQVLATGSYSQTAQLNLNLKNATIKEVLTEIENQSEFYFLYNSELIDVTRKVDISVKRKGK